MNKAILATIAVAGIAGTAQAQLFNEFQPNPVGGDPAMIPFELIGTPGDSFAGFIYTIETDFDAPNRIDSKAAVSGVFDSNGLLVVDVPDQENPSATYVLSSDGIANVGDDLDPVNFAAQFGTIFDAVNSPDAVADEPRGVAGLLGGTDLNFAGGEPILLARDSITLEWLQFANFNVVLADGTVVGDQATVFPTFDAVAGSFGAVNPTLVPAPASLALVGLGGLAATRRRR